jgi:protoporphyrinogen oxidase
MEADFLVLGGGLAGLGLGASLGDRAIVVEREPAPGGLVRTLRRGDYWFDRVIHILYFPDEATRQRVLTLAGAHLAPCTPRAVVDFGDAIAPFPVQTNLWAVPPDVRAACLFDLAAAADPAGGVLEAPRHYREQLQRTFGAALCELFFFPYNEKMWCRPLDELATTGFHWNLARPALDEARRGAAGPHGAPPYNGDGWYPRPPPGAPLRGMEVLTANLAQRVTHMLTTCDVRMVDPARREVTAVHRGRTAVLRWRERCLSSLPLPALIARCADVPGALARAVRRLPSNRVRSVALSVEGPRPAKPGHWRYYPSRDLCFTRLVHMCEFDPLMAPPNGWGMLAEVVERGSEPPVPSRDLVQAVSADVIAAGALPAGCRIIDAHVMDIDPAYVVFTPESAEIVASALRFLRGVGIEPVGRYGRWEYSSMAQVLRDAFALADGLTNASPSRVCAQ